MPDIIPTRQSRLRAAWLCIRSSRHYWHSALVTKLSVRQSPGFRARPGIRTFAEQLSAESVLRLLPSLKPLAWQSLSAPRLQSGAPLAETGHIIRPATIEEGVVRRDSVSVASLAASLAREFRSSIVCCELFRLGSLSNIFPISLSRPGFSSRAGDGAGSACGGPAGGVCCSWTPSAGGGGGRGALWPCSAGGDHQRQQRRRWDRDLLCGLRDEMAGSIEHDGKRTPKQPAGKHLTAAFRSFGARPQIRAREQERVPPPTARGVSRSRHGPRHHSG